MRLENVWSTRVAMHGQVHFFPFLRFVLGCAKKSSIEIDFMSDFEMYHGRLKVATSAQRRSSPRFPIWFLHLVKGSSSHDLAVIAIFYLRHDLFLFSISITTFATVY